jgi:hypothetical protein
MGVTKEVASQRLADDDVLLDAPAQGPRPWLHATSGVCSANGVTAD